MSVTFPEDFNLADYWLFAREREGKGSKVALRFGERTWTYAEVAHRARGLAKALVTEGLTPGQRVYIVLSDSPAFVWSIFGVLAAGGVVTMGNPIAPVEDLAYVVDYVGAAWLI
ncbi:MAG TPA: AMP-binding protein, partial [Kofleriaceae bacterium]|nr:AMP-binding protein [Kofleriaceae bacterium]